MNTADKGRRYDQLLEQHKQIEREITNVPKIPLDTVLQDVNSVEYLPENQVRINELRGAQQQINIEVSKLFSQIGLVKLLRFYNWTNNTKPTLKNHIVKNPNILSSTRYLSINYSDESYNQTNIKRV